ncbi:hypothetical protein A9Q84_08435 [Halobacteriovorax marinus]|uniref:TolB N-terminal domain-containing protein n=1 Tax=Halobacteriovorax marinus TaxID=97084 RepID=A0A1Y5FA42_9BACT|nr:hypothetical protein A9Q84_08435 [Halobacteriovorax marinus]
MKTLILLLLSFATLPIFAELNIVAIGEAGLELSKIQVSRPLFQGTVQSKNQRIADEIMNVLKSDFSFYAKEFSVEENLVTVSEGSIKYSSLATRNVNYLFRGIFRELPNGLRFTLEVFDIENSKKLIEQNFTLASKNARHLAHEFAYQTFKVITGKESVFRSKLIFVTGRHGTRKKPVKELYIMDFDGGNKKRLTFHKGVVISPGVSHDGTKVVYSLIKNNRNKHRNINLYLLDITTGEITLLSNRKGLNSGAVFMPDGKSIALTLSHVGNAEIFIMNLKSKKLERLTKSYSPDVDPSINKDGSMMTFLSGRGGKPMIYTRNMQTKKVQRISYVGKFNATPRFSPDGSSIVFSSWLDSRFDIFRIDSNGNNLARLTKDFGSNEDPTYSNDGQFIAFSSQRVLSRTKAVQNIYIMDNDGEIIGSITDNFGNCITPRWTKSL